jgi:cysteinyl-tRNA synthetase
VIVFDVLYRLLRHLYGEKAVTYVRNITDVDDKINARALRDFPDLPLNAAIAKVTAKTADQFQADAKALGCLEPTIQPRATDNIAGMIEMISTLITKGHAYEAAGEVLFSVGSMKDYGQLSNRKLDEQQAGARVAVEAHKKNPADFVLWKLSSAEEPGWESPWGRGRPGWHIECSAMSKRYLGEVFDIHGGGLDLIFPHHENEIAQSRCAHGSKVMANVWMHNGFLQVEGQKMSKSLGNFRTIVEELQKKEGQTLRLAMLMTHYRQPIDWTLARLREAEDMFVQWSLTVNDLVNPLNKHDTNSTDCMPDIQFVEALADDLNTHAAIVRLNAMSQKLRQNPKSLNQFVASLDLLGILIVQHEVVGVQPEQRDAIVDLINDRLLARHTKNWKESDRIRDQLDAMGIAIKDNKDGTTTWEVKR